MIKLFRLVSGLFFSASATFANPDITTSIHTTGASSGAIHSGSFNLSIEFTIPTSLSKNAYLNFRADRKAMQSNGVLTPINSISAGASGPAAPGITMTKTVTVAAPTDTCHYYTPRISAGGGTNFIGTRTLYVCPPAPSTAQLNEVFTKPQTPIAGPWGNSYPTYSTNDLIILSTGGTENAEGFHISLQRYDLASFTDPNKTVSERTAVAEALFPGRWICSDGGLIPSAIILNDYHSPHTPGYFPPGLYSSSFAVGPQWDVKHYWFLVQ